jgi:hypothetical protein
MVLVNKSIRYIPRIKRIQINDANPTLLYNIFFTPCSNAESFLGIVSLHDHSNSEKCGVYDTEVLVRNAYQQLVRNCFNS